MTRKPIQKPRAYTLQASQNYSYMRVKSTEINEKWVNFKSKEKKRKEKRKGTCLNKEYI